MVFAPRGHPLASRGEVRLADMEGESFVVREVGSSTRRVFEDGLRAAQVTTRVAVEMGSREAVREAVAQGLGLGVVADTAYVPDPRLVPLPLAGPGLFTHSHVICLAERRPVPLVAGFLAVVEALRSELTQRDPTASDRSP